MHVAAVALRCVSPSALLDNYDVSQRAASLTRLPRVFPCTALHASLHLAILLALLALLRGFLCSLVHGRRLAFTTWCGCYIALCKSAILDYWSITTLPTHCGEGGTYRLVLTLLIHTYYTYIFIGNWIMSVSITRLLRSPHTALRASAGWPYAYI